MTTPLESVRRELARLGLLRPSDPAAPDQSGFTLTVVSAYPIPAVRLDEGWSYADYDAVLLAAILGELTLTRDTEDKIDTASSWLIWEAVALAELWPANGRERLRKLAQERGRQ